MKAAHEIVRLKVDVPKDVHMTMGLVFADTSEAYGMKIQYGMCDLYPSLPPTTNATVVTQRGVMDRILLNEKTVSEALEEGSLRVVGRADNVAQFFRCFGAPTGRVPS